MKGALIPVFAGILLGFPMSVGADPQFLSLPFLDPSVRIQQGPLYTDGTRHFGGGFAIDYVQGVLDLSSTWTSFDVVAAAGGVAIQSFECGYGNFVLIRHDVSDPSGRRYFTLYAHLAPGTINPAIPFRSRYDTSFDQWSRVATGEFLGKAGSSGLGLCQTTSCIHLHFEVFRGGYFQNPVDPYDISTTSDVKTRDHYPDGPQFSECGAGALWITCPPTTPSPAPSPASVFQFEFAVSSLVVDGNILSRGSADGAVDFRDDFIDRFLSAFPTAALFSFSPISESCGLLQLRSADGANRFSPGAVVDNVALGLTDEGFRLHDGAGTADIRAAFRVDPLVPGAGFGLQLVTFGTNELVNIGVGGSGTEASVTAGYFPDPGTPVFSAPVPINLAGVERITLRLVLDDATNQVTPSFSLDGGTNFTPIAIPGGGRVFTSGNQALVSIFGSTQIDEVDTDGDGLADDWELAHWGNLTTVNDPSADFDGDGLTNFQEFQRGLNPTVADMDGDGFSDGREVALGTYPFDPTSKPRLGNDDFNDNFLDPAQWAFLGLPPGFSGAVSEKNQRLEVALGPGAGGTGIFTKCSLSGDFDVQVDYLLLAWPANNSHSLRLGAFDLGVGPFGGVGINRFSGAEEFYTMVFVDDAGGPATTDTSGKLRLVRIGSILSGFFHDGFDWVLVGSRVASTVNTRFNLDVGTTDPDAPGGIVAAFDNFRVNAGTVSCP